MEPINKANQSIIWVLHALFVGGQKKERDMRCRQGG